MMFCSKMGNSSNGNYLPVLCLSAMSHQCPMSSLLPSSMRTSKYAWSVRRRPKVQQRKHASPCASSITAKSRNCNVYGSLPWRSSNVRRFASFSHHFATCTSSQGSSLTFEMSWISELKIQRDETNKET